MSIMYFILFLGLMYVGLWNAGYFRHDHIRNYGNLDPSATIVSCNSRRISRNIETVVRFSDGFEYVSYMAGVSSMNTRRMTITVNSSIRLQICAKAVKKHEEAIAAPQKKQDQNAKLGKYLKSPVGIISIACVVIVLLGAVYVYQQSPIAKYKKAIYYYDSHRYEEALSLLEELGNYSEAAYYADRSRGKLADDAVKTGNKDKALEYLNAFLDEDYQARELGYIGSIYEESKDYTTAIELYRMAGKRNVRYIGDKDLTGEEMVAHVYDKWYQELFESGDYFGAAEIMRNAGSPETAELCSNYGECVELLNNQDYQNALVRLLKFYKEKNSEYYSYIEKDTYKAVPDLITSCAVKIFGDEYTKYKIGSKVTFHTNDGNDREFKIIDINTDNGNLLMFPVSKNCIKNLYFYSGKHYGVVAWETSNIRYYLNKDYYNSFTNEVKSHIVLTEVANPDKSGKNTFDKIFIFSKEEWNYYTGYINYSWKKLAESFGFNLISDIWTRTPDDKDACVVVIEVWHHMDYDYDSRPYNEQCLCFPVFWYNPNSVTQN